MAWQKWILCSLFFLTGPHVRAQTENAYQEAAKEAMMKKGGKLLEKLKRGKECLDKVSECLNNSEKLKSAINGAANGVNSAGECLHTADPEKQKACMEMVKTAYLKRKARKEEEEAQEAAQWAWDGTEGKEVRICTRGNNKPVGIVLIVTPTKVKIEINKGGGNAFMYYPVGEQFWVDIKSVGC